MLSILAVTAGLFCCEANAGGFYLQEQSVKANGRAWSGEVSGTGAPSRLWWNPAAIGGISNMEMFTGIKTNQSTWQSYQPRHTYLFVLIH